MVKSLGSLPVAAAATTIAAEMERVIGQVPACSSLFLTAFLDIATASEESVAEQAVVDEASEIVHPVAAQAVVDDARSQF